MSVQTFVLGFALLVAGVVFSQIVKHHLGWLVISGLSAAIGTVSVAYLIGHTIGVDDARKVVQIFLSEIAHTDSDRARDA